LEPGGNWGFNGGVEYDNKSFANLEKARGPLA
jgi:hypothetical protein